MRPVTISNMSNGKLISTEKGYFHQWSVDNETGILYGVIETLDGSVSQYAAHFIKFDDTEEAALAYKLNRAKIISDSQGSN